MKAFIGIELGMTDTEYRRMTHGKGEGSERSEPKNP